MFRLRCFALGMLALFVLSLTLHVSPAHSKPRSPQVIAAVFHADWCGKCKQMGPNAKKTMASYARDKDVKFVKFDLTNESTKAQSAKLAARNGITPVWNSNQKTGMVLLVDARTRKVVDTIVATDSQKDMKRKIEAARRG